MKQLRLALLLAVLTFLTTACASVGNNQPGIENFDRVSADLYRGAQPTDEGFKTLANYQIKTVINLRDGDDSAEKAAVLAAGMTYLALPLRPENVTAQDARKFLELFEHAPTPVFVHCRAGRDRTGLAVAAYRIQVQNWSKEETLKDLHAHGHHWVLYPAVKRSINDLAQSP